MIRTSIIGAAGRMGAALTAAVIKDAELTLCSTVDASDCSAFGQDAGQLAGLPPCGIEISADIDSALADSDAIIDFSAPRATVGYAERAVQHGCSLVIGTTGFSDEQYRMLRSQPEHGGRLVLAPNMSVGVNVLFSVSQQLASVLGDDYDIEIVESHHNRKKDAPSGTANRLAELLAQTRKIDTVNGVVHGRSGHTGQRPRDEIGVHAVRAGDIVGEHRLIFGTEGERIELSHTASSRETFARGAVRAVKFLTEASPGLYDMQDVLGLKQ